MVKNDRGDVTIGNIKAQRDGEMTAGFPRFARLSRQAAFECGRDGHDAGTAEEELGEDDIKGGAAKVVARDSMRLSQAYERPMNPSTFGPRTGGDRSVEELPI